MQCNLCGRETDLVDAVVEGVMLEVCEDCGKYGEIVRIKPKIVKKKVIDKIVEPELIKVIVNDYAKKIRKTRINLNLKQEELAKKLAEKESLISKIEAGKLEPSLELAEKLEKFLNIKLIEEVKENHNKKRIDFKSSNLTIGDLIKMKK